VLALNHGMPRGGVFALLALAACDTTPTVGGHHQPPPAVCAPADQWRGVRTLAVCPPDNWTNDLRLQYTNWFRAVIASYLQGKGYEFVPQVVLNRSMTKWKFTLAGELGLFKPAELCAEWKCDALIYWSILNENRLAFACVKADGTTLWATGERVLVPVYKIVGEDRRRIFGVAIGECLRDFPGRIP